MVFAIVFYISGEAFTIWLLEPANFSGGWAWLGVVLFPLLFMLFFVVQHYVGCASGHCTMNQQDTEHNKVTSEHHYTRPPGF